MKDEVFFSKHERNALRKTVQKIRKQYRVTNQALADKAGINVHAIRNFLSKSKSDPKGRTLYKLCEYIIEDFSSECSAEFHQLFESKYTESTGVKNLSSWNGDIRSLFPDVAHDFLYAVPESVYGSYVIYRRAAIGGDVVRASLLVSRGVNSPTFTNFYYDSLGRSRVTRGFVFNVGSALHLLGHVAPFPTLKLIVFKLPVQDPMRGLVISSDYRDDRFFSARCIAKKVKTEDAYLNDNNENPVPAEETGVFAREEIEEKRWFNQYLEIENLVANKLPGDSQVLFLDEDLI